MKTRTRRGLPSRRLSIASIARLRLQPGDVVMLHVSRQMDDAEADVLAKRASSSFGVQVVVIAPGMHVGVMSRGAITSRHQQEIL